MKEWWKSKIFSGVIFGLLALLAVLLVFKAGLTVGSRQADFACRWADNYHKNFAGPVGGFGRFVSDDSGEMDPGSCLGHIIKIDRNQLIVDSRENLEKVIVINPRTDIRRFRDSITSDDLKINDYIVAIGEPNNSGQISARFIRLLPPPIY